MLIYLCASVAALTFLVHTFAGGRVVARPLLADASLPPAAKWLSYYCWHIITVYLALKTVLLTTLPQAPPDVRVFVLLWSAVFAASFSILSATIAIRGQIHPFRLPSTTFFALLAVMSLVALLAERH